MAEKVTQRGRSTRRQRADGSGSGIWNVVDKFPIWCITSTNGDGGLVQATLEAVDGIVASAVFAGRGNCSEGSGSSPGAEPKMPSS